MALHLTTDLMRSTYSYLQGTRPFSSWGLPLPADIVFGFCRLPETAGLYTYLAGGRHRIKISPLKVGNTLILIETMAHEMTHVRQQMTLGRSNHGAEFRRLAAQVCRHHGFDPKGF